MKIDEKRIPQDGRFNFKGSEEEVDLRISSLPTTWGEKIVMRLLKKSGGVPELLSLPPCLKPPQKVRHNPQSPPHVGGESFQPKTSSVLRSRHASTSH